jgi:protein O-GlcNAc transferase
MSVLASAGDPVASDPARAIDPTDPIALARHGADLQASAHFATAIEYYDRALQIKPGLAGVLVNRGNALRSLRRFDAALLDMDAALRVKPSFPEAHNNRGNILRDLGQLEAAVAAFDAALLLRPEFPMALCNRGNALLDLKRPQQALASFEAALRLDPDDGEALFGRASALLRLQQRLEDALRDFDRAAARGIELPEILVGKAAALAELRRHEEAATVLADLIALAPERDYVRGSLLHSLLQTCNWANLPALIADLEYRVREGRKATHPQSLLSLSDSPELQFECARLCAADQHPQDDSLGPCTVRALEPGRRLRVAYVSADFCEHPVSYLLVGTLERHDRRRFEVIGIALQAAQDSPFGQRVRAAFDRFIDVTARTDAEVAMLLRELEVDIVVDLMGFTHGMRAGIFARRAAPVQVTYLGYAGTLGAPYMDYLLADDTVVPAGEEKWYSEQVVRLPDCFLPNDAERRVGLVPTRQQAGLPESGFVFCAFTTTYKMNPPVFDVWMRLLRQVDGSVLWLRSVDEQARKNLLREARERGIPAERLLFAPRVAGMDEHLGRHALADLYLDTLPYNAHSTICDALWAGVPAITCGGRSFPARVAASALTAVGLPELVTNSLADYEEQALELARYPERLLEFRGRLARLRASAPLFDTHRFTRHLETAYLTMAERAARGESPHGFAIASSGGASFR